MYCSVHSKSQMPHIWIIPYVIANSLSGRQIEHTQTGIIKPIGYVENLPGTSAGESAVG